jgi:MSHA biogenesis protein MshN
MVVVEGCMSVINKMLQDLDRRQAIGAASDAAVVRPSLARTGGREWFWRTLAVLLAITLGWMGWVAVQIMPKPLATELAFQAAAEARSRAAAKPAVPKPIAANPPVAEPKPVEPAAPPSDTLRLAVSLEAPPKEPTPEPARPDAAKVEVSQPAPPKPKPAPAAAPAKSAAPSPAPAKSSVDKRERGRSASESAEAYFRRAALLLNHGRVSEAEDQLVTALHADPSHVAARQAYIALLLEQQRVDVARRLLQDALVINPSQATFALALARIHAEQRDYLAALDVMDRAGSVARNPEFQALRAAVLQRLGRHGDATEAYQNAIRGGAQPATTWVGFGISLEALGRRSEAAQAYRRALAAGPIAAEAREYAENRARALE